MLEHLALAEEKAARLAAERATPSAGVLGARERGARGLARRRRDAAPSIGRLAVPYLADVSVVLPWGVDGNDAPSPHAAVVEPGRGAISRPLGEPLDDALAHAVECAGASARTVRLPDPGASATEGATVRFPFGAVAHSAMILPLAVGARVVGVLGARRPRPSVASSSDALAVAGDLADRAAAALDNALLYRRIQDSDQRKNEFLAMLAHELRNPLAPIANAVQVLKMAANDPGTVDWAREVIGRQLSQLTRLVDDLLDLARITRGRIELKLETLDVAAVVASAIETCRPIVEAHGHTVAVTLPPSPLAIRGDFARFAQVLGNLVNNAAKYTEPGGCIEVSAAPEGDAVVFRVRDNGAGIPSHALATVFEPFTQLERTLDRAQGGLGIGLTLVRRLVEMQGGSVTAHSEGWGKGSEFVVRVPAVEADAKATAPVTLPDWAGPAPRVLVVDDNADVADSTAILLRSAGCEVHVARDGRSALEQLETMAADAVLLDIGLPGMDGYQVAERIRARPGHRKTLILAVSGYGHENFKARSRAAGVDDHLVKPIDLATIMGLLRERAAAAGNAEE